MTCSETGLLAGTATGSWMAAAGLLLFASLFVTLALGLAWDRWSVLSTRWESVPGSVRGAHLRTLEATEVGEDDTYAVSYSYLYEVDGRRYEGTATDHYGTDQEWARTKREGIPDGTPVTVYYAPSNPARSRLDLSEHPEVAGLVGMLLGLALVLLPFALGFVAQGTRRSARAPLSARQLWLLGLRNRRLRSPAFSERPGLVGLAMLVAGSVVLALTFLAGLGLTAGAALWLGLTLALSPPLFRLYDGHRGVEWRAHDGTLIVRLAGTEERLAASELVTREGGLTCQGHELSLPDLGAAECQELALALFRS